MNELEALLKDAVEVEAAGGWRVLALPPRPGPRGAVARVDLFLALLRQVGAASIIVDSHPTEDGQLPGEWAELAPGQWAMPDVPLDLGQVLEWLSGGNWQAVGFAEPDAVGQVDPIDLFGDPSGARGALDRSKAAWALDVFDDDGEWRLAQLV